MYIMPLIKSSTSSVDLSNYVTTQSVKKIINGLYIWWDTTNRLLISAGNCYSENNGIEIVLGDVISKTVSNGTYVYGENGNMNGSGMNLSTNTWYSVFLIKTTSNVVDVVCTLINTVLFTSVLPGILAYKRIGYFLWNASAQIEYYKYSYITDNYVYISYPTYRLDWSGAPSSMTTYDVKYGRCPPSGDIDMLIHLQFTGRGNGSGAYITLLANNNGYDNQYYVMGAQTPYSSSTYITMPYNLQYYARATGGTGSTWSYLNVATMGFYYSR